MAVYLGKERKCASLLMTATDDSLTRPIRIENVGHKFYMNQSSPWLFDDSSTNTVEMLSQKEKGC
jgi:hypothetical protein